MPEHGAPGKEARWAAVWWAWVEGPLVAYAAGYRRELEQCGFSARAVRGRMEVMGQLNRWLAAERLSAADLTVDRAGQFFAARRAATCSFGGNRTMRACAFDVFTVSPWIGY